MFKMREWVQTGNYTICVHEAIDRRIPKGGRSSAAHPTMQLPDGTLVHVSEDIETERVIYINVEYRNNSDESSLSCRRNQWYLYDAEGYSYEATSGRDYLYDQQGMRYLGGERFINFQVPDEAQIERVQFITAFLGTKSADVKLHFDSQAAQA